MDRTRRAAIVGHFLLISGVCTLFVGLLMVAELIDYRSVQTAFASTPLAETTLWRTGATFLAGVGYWSSGSTFCVRTGRGPSEKSDARSSVAALDV